MYSFGFSRHAARSGSICNDLEMRLLDRNRLKTPGVAKSVNAAKIQGRQRRLALKERNWRFD
jgi:hypothetical protein